MRIVSAILLGSCLAGVASAKLKEREVEYKADTVSMKGYIVYDDATKGKRPGVLVVHEWWGQNQYARKRAQMLAELGYTALAVDMYGNGKQAEHPDDAGKFAAEVMQNMPQAKARFLAALKLLGNEPTVDQKRIAAIGYCFGGGVVLQMARLGVDLAGVVSFHGSLGTQQPAATGKVKAKLLVCNGADDPFVSKEAVEGFKQEMDSARVDYTFVSYAGAKHSFTNPDADANGKKFNLPLAYNKKADEESWKAMKMFFKTVFAAK
ncbi:MAG: dienelactone hydrolase family protein [Ignavibacteria bacterium]|nr:dienelactone hydrolase family protein [Ignavibacteria bacterium]